MKQARALLLFALLPACLAAGCSGTGSTVYLNDGMRPGKPVFHGTVEVFAAREIGVPVEELGSVCVTIGAEVPGAEFLKLMQIEAGKIGANAVVAYEHWGHSAVGIAVRYKRGVTGSLPADSSRQVPPLRGTPPDEPPR